MREARAKRASAARILRVLLVEDSEDDALLLLRELRRGGYRPRFERVYTPAGMERALREAEAAGNPYEIVISDYYMPRFRAPEALELLRELDQDIPFIVVSGKVGEDAAVEVMKAGADDYLTKENMSRLCPAIERELREAGVRRDRERAERALSRSEERFRATFEQAAVGILQVGLDGGWLRFNDKFCDIVGYEREELGATSVFSLISPEDFDRDFERGVSMLAGELRDYTEEKLIVGKGGRRVWINLTVSLVHDESDEPRYFIAVVEDIGKRKRAEEALGQSEALYRTVVEQAAENIFLVDAQSRRVLEANEALLLSLGYTEDELKRMTLYDIVAHDPKSVDLNIWRIMEQGTAYLGERQYRRKDGSLADVEVNVSAVPYNDERAMCVVAHDVTERKRAEAMLEEIREAERNRIARELHDSTLQDIVYALQEIQIMQVVAGDDGDPALEDAAEALRRSVEGLRGAIFELRLEETLDRSLVSSLENLVDLNRRMSRGRYELELVVGDDFPARLPDKTGQEITRLVQEALTNVRRHAEADHARVELGLEGDLAHVEISDDGRGFDVEKVGIGMGRQSMNHRALELGGRLGVQSAPGGGTRVRFSIPLSRLLQG